MGKRLDQLTGRVDAGFEKLDERLASLAVIAQMERRLDGRIDGLKGEVDTRLGAMNKSISDNWKLTWGQFALLVTAVLGIATGLVRAFG
jgi:hypothetical protein